MAEIRTLRQKLARSSTLKRGIYENYIEGVLSKKPYLSAKEEYTKTEAAIPAADRRPPESETLHGRTPDSQ